MKPIDKFIDVKTIYPFADNDSQYIDYVWNIVMGIMPDVDEENHLECSYSMPIFKKRYNERLIKMPFTYEEYIANEDIQETIKGLGYDIDKFWFALLFVWDYCEGECFQALELMNDPYLDLILFPKAILEHDHENRNPLNEEVNFDKELKITLQVGNKTVYTIENPNSIKYIAMECQRLSKEIESHINEIEYDKMFTFRKKGTHRSSSNSFQIYLFYKLFTILFNTWGMPKKKIRSGKGEVSYSRLFLISKLIYLTRISNNDEFYYEPTTLKGYVSRYKNRSVRTRGITNRIYRNFDKGE